jgi:hypothetical protein
MPSQDFSYVEPAPSEDATHAEGVVVKGDPSATSLAFLPEIYSIAEIYRPELVGDSWLVMYISENKKFAYGESFETKSDADNYVANIEICYGVPVKDLIDATEDCVRDAFRIFLQAAQ